MLSRQTASTFYRLSVVCILHSLAFQLLVTELYLPQEGFILFLLTIMYINSSLEAHYANLNKGLKRWLGQKMKWKEIFCVFLRRELSCQLIFVKVKPPQKMLNRRIFEVYINKQVKKSKVKRDKRKFAYIFVVKWPKKSIFM